MTVELPRLLLADRLTWLLILGSAGMTEAVLWRHPGLPAGVGLAAAVGLCLWQRAMRRKAPVTAVLGASGWRIQCRDGACLAARAGPGTRVLGRSVVLHWCSGRRSGRLWLTPADLRPEVLRLLILRLRSSGAEGLV
jgi:hypothetical protein